jgi:hypothetical protein
MNVCCRKVTGVFQPELYHTQSFCQGRYTHRAFWHHFRPNSRQLRARPRRKSSPNHFSVSKQEDARVRLYANMKTRNATRASKGLPRKRPSYDLEALRPSRSKKRASQEYSLLMKLPAEVRLKILRELLWTPEPLRLLREASPNTLTWTWPTVPPSWDGNVTGTNFTLCPEILAACRKLNEEGSPVLYEENTMDVVASYDLGYFPVTNPVSPYGPINPEYPYGTKLEWMGRLSSLAGIPESFNARARKLRITVEVRTLFCGDPRRMRGVVRELVKVLRANPQWCSLDVRLEDHRPRPVGYGIFSEEQDEIYLDEEILRPLNSLRRIRHIEFTGVSPQFAAELTELVKSDRPIIEPLKMYDSLKSYVDNYISDGTEEDLELAENAAEADNMPEFYRYRDKLIWTIEKFLRKEREDVFKNDPDPTRSRLSNHEFIAEQDRLENLEGQRELVEAL